MFRRAAHRQPRRDARARGVPSAMSRRSRVNSSARGPLTVVVTRRSAASKAKPAATVMATTSTASENCDLIARARSLPMDRKRASGTTAASSAATRPTMKPRKGPSTTRPIAEPTTNPQTPPASITAATRSADQLSGFPARSSSRCKGGRGTGDAAERMTAVARSRTTRTVRGSARRRRCEEGRLMLR